MEKVTKIHLDTIDVYANDLVDYLKAQSALNTDQATILLIEGDLGAGKTTLTQAIGRILGVKDHIVSPTYVISRRYPIEHEAYSWNRLIHTDTYRLEHAEDLKKIAYDNDCKNPEYLMIFEWPERVGNYFDAYNVVRIRIDMGEKDDERMVTIID